MTDIATPIDVEDIYELSPMQVAMLFQSVLAPASGIFVEQQAIRLAGAIAPMQFERAWQAVVDRTPVLRTSFHWGDLDKPVQIVHRNTRIHVDRLDWRAVPASAQDHYMTMYMREVRARGFELDRAPLMRLALARSSETDTWFIWHFHHLLLDGWSGQLLLQEVFDEYAALMSGQRHDPPMRPPFSDYIAWLHSQSESDAEAFWRAQLRGFSTPTPIGFGRPRAFGAPEGNEGEHEVRLSEDESESLRSFAKTHRITVNTIVQGAWALLLSRYSGESDVVHGVVVSGRPPELPGVDTMIGLFINTLPMRVALSRDEGVVAWLQRLQAHHLKAVRYQYISSLQLQQWSEVRSGTRLYDTVVVFENFPIVRKRDTQSQPSEDPLYWGRTDVAITLVVLPSHQIRMMFLYDHLRFEAREIRQMAGHFATLLREMTARADARLQDISLLTDAERRRVLVEWNATASPGYDDIPLMELLEKQAEQTPDSVAFIDGGSRATIREVHERSNQMAHFLASQGVGAGTVVGVCCERSVEAVIAFLAVLKLSAVFLPLDPSYPRDRLAYMVADAGAAVVLGLDASLAPVARALAWSEVWPDAARCSTKSAGPHATPEDLAYIIYTSGSTGRPKGVAVEHRAVLNRLVWMWREYPFAPGEVGVMKTALNFVDAFWEMLGGLLRGVPTVVARQNVVADPEAFLDLLAAHAVTRLWFVPSFLELLLECCPDLGRRLPALRFWSSGGEPLSAELYRRFQRAAPGAVLYNVFGTSELWDATVFDPERDGPVTDGVPIGRPIANTEAFILDLQHQPVPIGVTGTLHIAGASVARGYVHQDALTRRHFIPHPFSSVPSARLYDTGDLARFRQDGVIEYVGRRDLQLNIRGFRIEPSEIETLIDSHPSVRESVVVSRQSGDRDQRFVAYVVPRNGSGDTKQLLAYLSEWLPSFMMPSIAWIDAIPMTPSGKRDRNQLPDPMANAEQEPESTGPASPLETAIVRHFCEVLGIDNVRLHDHFFADLGGHSLLATRLMARLRESTGIDVPLRAIFDAPTPSALAAAIDGLSRTRTMDTETESILADLAALPAAEADALLASLKEEARGDEA